MTDIVTQLLLNKLPFSAKKTRDGQKFNCPMCIKQGEPRLDTKSRGGLKINPDGFIYHCFNCKFSAGYQEGTKPTKKCLSLLTTLGVNINEIPLEIRLGKKATYVKKIVEVPSHYSKIELPENSKCILDLIEQGYTDPNFDQVVEYLSTEASYLIFNRRAYWSPSTESMMNKRFILPFYFNGNIVGWTSRYYKKKVMSNIPKYIMERPENYIYNMDILKNNKEYVLLVEGPTDAEAVGGIALMTNKINDIEAEILHRSRKKVIVIPDMEKTGESLVSDAGKYGFHVALPQWAKDIKDPAEAVKEYGKFYTLKTIFDSTCAGSTLELETRFKLRIL